jgi:membrane protein
VSSAPPSLRDAFAYLRSHPRQVAGEVRRALVEKRVISHASAISYQLLFALIAFTLAAMAVLSVVGLGDNVWDDGLRHQAHDHLSKPAFQLVDDTVKQIQGPKRTLWLTVGLAFAIWRLSVAARVTMNALDELLETHARLPLVPRFLRSLGLAAGAGACLLAAAAIVLGGGSALGHLLPGPVSFVLRWGCAVVLMLLAAALIFRYAPAKRQPVAWVSVGTVVVALSWALASIGFGLYAAYIARWDSLFGGLTSLIALLFYFYISAISFLVGAQLDVELRKAAGRATGQAGARGRARGARRARRGGVRGRAREA